MNYSKDHLFLLTIIVASHVDAQIFQICPLAERELSPGWPICPLQKFQVILERILAFFKQHISGLIYLSFPLLVPEYRISYFLHTKDSHWQ